MGSKWWFRGTKMKNFIVYVIEMDDEVQKTWRTYEGPAESWEDIEQQVIALEGFKSTDSIGDIIDITSTDNHFIAN
jgi:hypothetical protein